MKIGIVTFSHAYNYGAILQCLALYRTIQNMGHDVDVIRYIPNDRAGMLPRFWQDWGLRSGIDWERIQKRCIMMRYGSKMVHNFDEFKQQYISLSPTCSSNEEIEEIVNNYDALVCGSDQVWHFAQSPMFFLEWNAPYSGRKISYAACCGALDQPDADTKKIGAWIRDFDFISVRNDFSRDHVKEISGMTPEIVADPTLLVDLNDIQECPNGFQHKKYILMYMLGPEINGGHTTVLESIKKKVGNLPVVAIVSSAHKPRLFPWANTVIYTAGPAEWVYLIANAAFVYTDSFHGALFSITNHRPFLICFAEQWRAARLMDIKKRYLLDQAVINHANEADERLKSFPLNYKAIDNKTASHVKSSFNYLKKALA